MEGKRAKYRIESFGIKETQGMLEISGETMVQGPGLNAKVMQYWATIDLSPNEVLRILEAAIEQGLLAKEELAPIRDAKAKMTKALNDLKNMIDRVEKELVS